MTADSDWACTTAFPSVTFLLDAKQSQQTGNEMITPGRQASTAVFRKKKSPIHVKGTRTHAHTHTHTHTHTLHAELESFHVHRTKKKKRAPRKRFCGGRTQKPSSPENTNHLTENNFTRPCVHADCHIAMKALNDTALKTSHKTLLFS